MGEGFLWEDGMRGFPSEVVGYECATGPKPEVTLPSAIPSLLSLPAEYLNALALPVLIQFCCCVAASTGSCTPCELELLQVPACGGQYSQQEWFNTPQPHGIGPRSPPLLSALRSSLPSSPAASASRRHGHTGWQGEGGE